MIFFFFFHFDFVFYFVFLFFGFTLIFNFVYFFQFYVLTYLLIYLFIYLFIHLFIYSIFYHYCYGPPPIHVNEIESLISKLGKRQSHRNITDWKTLNQKGHDIHNKYMILQKYRVSFKVFFSIKRSRKCYISCSLHEISKQPKSAKLIQNICRRPQVSHSVM